MPKFKPIVIPDSELLTAPECAALLRVQLSTVRAWILHKRLPVVRFGKRCVRFRRSDLDALIAQSLIPADAVGQLRARPSLEGQ
jgi:excisionase family DNA binding protein